MVSHPSKEMTETGGRGIGPAGCPQPLLWPLYHSAPAGPDMVGGLFRVWVGGKKYGKSSYLWGDLTPLMLVPLDKACSLGPPLSPRRGIFSQAPCSCHTLTPSMTFTSTSKNQYLPLLAPVPSPRCQLLLAQQQGDQRFPQGCPPPLPSSARQAQG